MFSIHLFHFVEYYVKFNGIRIKFNSIDSIQSAPEMVWRILFSRSLNCPFVIGFFAHFLVFFDKNKWLFFGIFVYFDSQPKLCFQEKHQNKQQFKWLVIGI